MAIYRGSGGSLDGQTESLSFPVSISQGGTGQTDPNKAFNALAPTQQFNSGKYLKTDGANTSWDNIEISTADISGVLALSNGGTGASDTATARTNLGLAIGTDVPSPTGTGASGTWAIDVTGNAATVTNGVYTTGNQTIAGTKTFSSTIVGDISGNAGTVTNGVYTSGNQTIAGIKTFSSTIVGDISGNAGTVTNGVYTTGSYTNPSWIASLDGSKLTGTVVATNGVVTTGSYTNPTWIASLDGSKLTGTVVATNGIVSTGSYADPAWITSLAGSKITGNISGNAANVTGTVAIANGGTGATTAANARVSLLPSYTGNAGKVLGLNGTATDVEWVSSAGSGSVTSVGLSAPTGFTVTGSPVTSSGTLALAFATGYSLPTTTKQSEWDTAYTDRLKWDGGSTGLNAATARTSLGLVIGTDVQAYDAQLADVAGLTPTDNGVIIGNGTNFVVESGNTFRTSVGLAIGTDVPSPTGTGASGTWGISITGNAATVTNGVVTTGSYADPTWITSLSGTKLTGTVVATNGVVTTGSYANPSWITSLAGSKITGNISGNAANVTGTVAVANGGTGATTLTGYVKGNGTSAMTASATISGSDIDGGTINGGTY